MESIKFNVRKTLQVLGHSLGLSSLASTVFLQSTVFTSIIRTGYFAGVEHNTFILSAEMTLTGFAISYLGYIVVKFIWANR